MAINWISGFIIPLVEITFFTGLFGFILFFVGKGFYKGWTKAGKFIWKYKIRRRKYPESTVKWVIECIDKGVGWYDAKKLLLVKMYDQKVINETMWIYDQIIIELNKEKGGNYYGKLKRYNSKIKGTTEYPTDF